MMAVRYSDFSGGAAAGSWGVATWTPPAARKLPGIVRLVRGGTGPLALNYAMVGNAHVHPANLDRPCMPWISGPDGA
ncbi:unnamed protein product, partial [Cladocopium goreaui]